MGLHERVWVCSKCGRVAEEPYHDGFITGLEFHYWRKSPGLCFGTWLEVETRHKGLGTLGKEGPIEVVWPKGVPREVAERMQGPC